MTNTKAAIMDYETCLRACVSVLRQDGTERALADIHTLSNYPIPSAAEWAEVLRRGSELSIDYDNPFDWMGGYEMELSQRGIPTVLGSFVNELKKCAGDAGIPDEYIPAAIVCFMHRNGTQPS